LPSRATASQPFEVSIGLTPRPKATKTEVSFPLMIVNDTDLFNGAPMLAGVGWHRWASGAGPEQRRRRLLLAITGCAEGVDRGGEMNRSGGFARNNHGRGC
jgi:hypothetical protein